VTGILDAQALLAFFGKERGHEKVESALIKALEAGSHLLIASVNFGEVYYVVLRRHGSEKAEEVARSIQSLPIEVVDVDLSLAKEAGRFKAKHKISYADCFAAALTKLNKGELLTGDKEFKRVESEIRVTWI
jgi:predicted nucleic acid-binding protein